MRKLFHEKMNARMPVATMPGLASGIAMAQEGGPVGAPVDAARLDQLAGHVLEEARSITHSTSGIATIRCVRG
jgi:hypothetical protein